MCPVHIYIYIYNIAGWLFFLSNPSEKNNAGQILDHLQFEVNISIWTTTQSRSWFWICLDSSQNPKEVRFFASLLRCFKIIVPTCNISRYSCCLWQHMFIERRIICCDTSSIYLLTWAVITEPLCWHPAPNQSPINKLLRNAKRHSQKMSISVGESPSLDGLETTHKNTARGVKLIVQ